MQSNDRAVPGIEATQGLIHELAVRQMTRNVGRRRGIERGDLDLDRTPSPVPRDVETDIDGQAMQPCVEPIRVAKARQVAPSPDQRLLDRVARELRVPKDEASGRVQPREGRVDELGEGVMIAPLRASDELSLVHGRLDCVTTTAVVFDRVWRRRWQIAAIDVGDPGERAEARRATYLRILSSVPQSSIEHQRRLRFLLSSTKWKRHDAQPFTRSSGPR